MKPVGKTATKKKTKISLDFTGVTTRTLLPEGQYHARVAEITQEEGNEYPYLKWVFEVIDDNPKLNGGKLFYNTSFTPKALWNLRNLLETLGIEVPDGPMDLSIDDYIGLELMVRVEHETYEGKDRAKVTDFTPLEGVAEADDDETPAEAEDEETEEEETAEAEDEEEETTDEVAKISADEVAELDDKELADLVKTNGLKIDLKSIPKKSKRIGAVCDALEAKGLLA